MRTFELDNVIKKTDNETKIKKYLAQGFKEVKAKKEENKAPEKETTENKAPEKKAETKKG